MLYFNINKKKGNVKMVRISIYTEGAAFANERGNYTNYSKNTEVARILRKLADQISENPDVSWDSVILMDQNGNSVGSFISLNEK